MATITLIIPDAQLQRVIEGLCSRAPRPIDQPPPPVNGATAKAVVVDWIKQVVLEYERQAAVVALPVPDVGGVVS